MRLQTNYIGFVELDVLDKVLKRIDFGFIPDSPAIMVLCY